MSLHEALKPSCPNPVDGCITLRGATFCSQLITQNIRYRHCSTSANLLERDFVLKLAANRVLSTTSSDQKSVRSPAYMCSIYFTRQSRERQMVEARRNCHGNKLNANMGAALARYCRKQAAPRSDMLCRYLWPIASASHPAEPATLSAEFDWTCQVAGCACTRMGTSTCACPMLYTTSPFSMQKYTLQNLCIHIPYFSNPSAASVVLYIRIGPIS
jgi:hypothetical protein